MAEQQGGASLVGGHAQFVKGAAQDVVGSVTGSEQWKKSAEHDKQVGTDKMKAASEERDPSRDGYGKVEEVAGKALGCEGMENEGKESQ